MGDNSDLIIMDNNFASIQASIRWGRAMFANVGKVLQFQMTINIAVVSLALISGMTLGSVPLNLILDILAAISLGTEPVVKKARVPFAERETRISRASRIFTAAMWRHIVVQSAYQLTVLLALLYFGTFMFFDEPYNLVTEPSRRNNAPTSKMTVDTIIFNTFFMMNMFNQITCRTMDDDINFNWIFWAVFAVEMLLQHFMLYLAASNMGGAILGMTTLTWVQYTICVLLGALSLPVAVASRKFLPTSKFETILVQ